MREKDLIAAIHRRVRKDLHHQSMTSASLTHNGTPDQYYDGPVRDFWIEYKMLKSMPRSGVVVGAYTEKQLAWMMRRYDNSLNLLHGPNVFGIVGLPNRSAVIQRNPTEWREGTPLSTAISFKEVALCLDSGFL
jgi:hypothetical protein